MPISKSEVSYTLYVGELLRDVPEEDRDDALTDAANAAIKGMTEYMDNQQSPVKGQRAFKALSDGYAKVKKGIAGNKKANLLLYGDLREAIDYEVNDNSFTIFVNANDEKQVLKAYNHNVGDTLPKRQFLPDDRAGQSFKKDIVEAIKSEIEKYQVEKEEKQFKLGAVEGFVPYEDLFQGLKASKRELELAKDISKLKLSDIL